MKWMLWAVLACVGCGPRYAAELACTEEAWPGPTHPDAAPLQAVLDAWTSDGVPGAVAWIHDREHGSWLGASGYADLHTASPMRTCHRFRVASVTKHLSAAMTMALVEQGAIGLDDRIATHLPADLLPDLPNRHAVTLQHLLQHRSGIPDFSKQSSYQLHRMEDFDEIPTPEEALSFVEGSPPRFAPGQQFEYTNGNYALLQLVVEEATGRDDAALLVEEILAPTGMRDTLPLEAGMPPGLATGYAMRRRRGQLMEASNHWVMPFYSSGTVSTVPDLARFAQALQRGRLLTEDGVARMIDCVRTEEADTDRTGYGLGTACRDEPSWRWGHGGRVAGHHSLLEHWPEQGVTIILAQNAIWIEGRSHRDLSAELESVLFARRR